ncbi:S41 family peptidase [Flavobacterium sp. AC]|uniref:S41 family peptidase n=1 Tax=Flavobacterium azizsancarii TaxID=2961580 RepID=A0ABT4W9W6_9FLAO|nr:S41 family peptidase [Flavobacterium azizsancarii]MDA6069335.1 S41 family peptidase [Flavobacterium azizsancarii]
MKKKILLLFIVLLYTISGNAKISEIEKLATTCKVWGFLKYYHPVIASGKTNWDEQLFKVLPEIINAKSKEEFSAVLESWISSQGVVPATKILELHEKASCFNKNLNLDWITNHKFFSKELSEKLQFIADNRFQGQNYYVLYNEEAEVHLKFTNENEYPDFQWQNLNLRILALFRYWNYVEYFFPYKYQMDQNWDNALLEILPHISTPDSEEDFTMAMRELSVKLNDSHAATFNMKMMNYLGGEKYPAFGTKIIDKKIIVTQLVNDSVAKIDDIKVGDLITKINGKTIPQITKEIQKYLEGSNKPAALSNLGWVALNGNTDELEIEYIRDNKSGVKKIHRYEAGSFERKINSKPKWKLLENNIGYVNMGKLEVDDVKIMMEEFKNTKAIIFDVRNRPKGTHRYINDYLNPEPRNISKFIFQDLSFPGRFIWKNEMEKCGKTNSDYYKGEVIVLVNETTLSHAEYTVMSFQTAPKTTIIGSQTSGADGANYSFTIIKDFNSSFTSQGVFYPNKKETQRIGIPIDVEVKPTILGIQQGKDEVLDKAILFVNNKYGF